MNGVRSSMDYKIFYKKESVVYHARRYETKYGKLFKRLHHYYITKLLESIDKKFSLLEVACGTGHTSQLLANLGFDFIACDLTPQMMAQAREKIEKTENRRVDFIETNAMSLPFSDASFDLLVSTRFLHLFPLSKQKIILQEMIRVLKPGGKILVDFDNWSSRWIMMIPFAIYNIIRYKRLAPYSIYNRINQTSNLFQELGVTVNNIIGVGGTHLIFPVLFSENVAFKIGKKHRHNPLRILSEQFIVFGSKQ